MTNPKAKKGGVGTTSSVSHEEIKDPSEREPSPNAGARPLETRGKSSVSRLLAALNFSWVSYLSTLIVFTVPFVSIVFLVQDVSDPKQRPNIIKGTLAYWTIISVLYFAALLFTKIASQLLQKKSIEKDISNLYDQLETGDFFTTLIRCSFA